MPPSLEHVVAQINVTGTLSWKWSANLFGKMVNAHDPCNRRLAFPADLQHYERAEPLPANLVVHGTLFTVTWNAHWPRLDIMVHEDDTALADHAETWLGKIEGFWAFRDGRIIDCIFVDTRSLVGYDVHEAVAGHLIGIQSK